MAGMRDLVGESSARRVRPGVRRDWVDAPFFVARCSPLDPGLKTPRAPADQESPAGGFRPAAGTSPMYARFLHDDRGLETVEYAIIAGLIVGACVVAVIALGGWVQATYHDFQNEIGA